MQIYLGIYLQIYLQMYLHTLYICIYIYIYISLYTHLYIYRHHSYNISMPIDQHGLRQPKVGDKIIAQQRAGCRGPPAQSEDAKLKAQPSTHTQILQHADQICRAS